MSPSPCTSVLILRPGALGDAILTLPVLQALRTAGTQRVVVLGNPANWRWLRATGIGVTVADWNGPEWLGLFSPDVELGPPARRELEGVQRALIYLRSGLDATVARLRQFGIHDVVLAPPPVWPEHPDDADDRWHATERLLEPLAGWCGAATERAERWRENCFFSPVCC